MAEIHKKLYKKGLNDPYNHNGVITHLETDILECEVQWASGSITANKASGGHRENLGGAGGEGGGRGDRDGEHM